MKVSIVMATYNRRQLLINTLKTIEHHNKGRDIEVIIVDDNSSPAESIKDVPTLFKIPVIVLPITAAEKRWYCCCTPFNIGFSFATGEIIIIQNPENLHVGDIVGHAIQNLKDGLFLSYGLYSMNQADTDNLINNCISKSLFSASDIKRIAGTLVGKKDQWTDGDTCWYNHSQHRPAGCHLISAITRNDLEDLQGFDERYGPGFAYDDPEFKARMLRKGMSIKIIDEPFAIHQKHELADYRGKAREFKRNEVLYINTTLKEKTYHAPENLFYKPERKMENRTYNDIVSCPITGATNPLLFLDLGRVPLVNNLCKTLQESLACQKFPLAVQIFPESKLSCLVHTVNKEKLFLDYFYHSGANKPYLEHCEEMFEFLDKFIGIKPSDHVFDIGGNDGSLLEIFRELNPFLTLTNIDASQSFIEDNRAKNIRYINRFFDESFLAPIKANLIISTNVFQHTLPIRSFVKGVFNNLSDSGIWCLEFPYLLTTMMYDNYDQVYHEHIYYYLLSNIIDLLKQEKMKVINASFHEIHSGTLRVLSCKETNPRQPNDSINSFLALENTLSEEYYLEWGRETHQKIEKFKEFIFDLKKSGARIAGFGAAAKGCVFLNTCGIDNNTIDFIIDDTHSKQWRFVPGTGIQVVPRSELKNKEIDYILILAHNFKDYIINSLKSEYSGQFIVMFPEVKII